MKLSKSFIFKALVFTAFSSLNAATVTFPIKGFQTVPASDIPISTEWDEKWFGKESAKVYNHDIARIAGILSEVSYVEVERNAKEVVDCYKVLGVKEKDIELHYNLDYKHTLWGNDQAAFSLAHKQIDSAKGKRNLIFVVIRGTPLNANEWISNLNISDRTKNEQEFHEGFLKATKQVENALIAYLLKNKIDIEDCFLLITGHSRGAAISNLLAAQLYQTDLFNTDNIYTYTFAAPNVTIANDVDDEKYGYIWNIVNAEDIVPTVPMNAGVWKFRKYGNIKTIINSWNTDYKKYHQYYLPTMNLYYNKFLERNFCPFQTGPFLPIQISAIATNINPTVTAYYNSIREFRSKGEAAFWKIFPPISEITNKAENTENTEKQEEPSTPSTPQQGTGFIAAMATKYAYREFGVDTNYLINSFVDMHAMESYLSWILALDEDTVYSTTGTNVLIINGSGDYAIFDDTGKTIATILDGKVSFEKIKLPAAASSILQDHVSIGLPANQKFSIAISKESLLPTFIKIKIHHYNSYGVLEKVSPEKTLYPTFRTVYTFESETEDLSPENIRMTKLHGKQKKEIKKKGEIENTSQFRVLTETSGSSSGTFNAGIHVGSSNFYGSLLFGHNAAKIGRSLEISPGFGKQVILTDRILLDSELFSQFFYAISDDVNEDDKRLNIVPSLRCTLSFKPKHRLQFFAGVNVDCFITDFNDAAFDEDYRLKFTRQVSTGSKLHFIHNYQMGIKF